MSAFTPLAAILGILFGGGMMYLYLGKINKKRMNEALDFIEKNPEKFNTLKSEPIDQGKKEGETPKEEPAKDPAPSSSNQDEVKEENVDEKLEEEIKENPVQ